MKLFLFYKINIPISLEKFFMKKLLNITELRPNVKWSLSYRFINYRLFLPLHLGASVLNY